MRTGLKKWQKTTEIYFSEANVACVINAYKMGINIGYIMVRIQKLYPGCSVCSESLKICFSLVYKPLPIFA
jgi:hypothetical protein